MTVDIFLHLPGIVGASADRDHKDWIELTSATWGLDQSGAAHACGGAGRGKATQHPLVVSAPTSIATPVLFEFVANGRHLPTAVLDVVRSGEDRHSVIRWDLDDVEIARLDVAGSAPGFDDVFEVRSRRTRMTVVPTDAKGGAGQPVTRGWDFTAQQSW
ncbi:Hcp family type VI secretion system effector [Microbacterium sp.]|uniref:Hcp family type VI secretion system effector n=1 Tax=Microbacterium sp. TaxID=51671 RepID=UPI003F70A8D4